MIRERKPVRLLEWGEGTNTLNQVWSVAGEGKIVKKQMKDGVTTLVIQLNGPLDKKNGKDNSIKLAQVSEGMSSHSSRWGEVAIGTLKAVEQGGRTVQVEILTATKIDSRKHD